MMLQSAPRPAFLVPGAGALLYKDQAALITSIIRSSLLVVVSKFGAPQQTA